MDGLAGITCFNARWRSFSFRCVSLKPSSAVKNKVWRDEFLLDVTPESSNTRFGRLNSRLLATIGSRRSHSLHFSHPGLPGRQYAPPDVSASATNLIAKPRLSNKGMRGVTSNPPLG